MPFRRLSLLLVLPACQDYALVNVNDGPSDPPGWPDLEIAYPWAEEAEPAPVDSAEPTFEDPILEDSDPGLTIDGIPLAAYPVYAHTRDTLHTVDPVTGDTLLIGRFLNGNTPVDGMIDIAIDTQGRMFGGTQGDALGNGRTIWRIDPSNGAVTHHCDTPLVLYALTFLSDGRLVAGDASDLKAVDLANNCAITTIAHSEQWATSGDVVALPDGLIYWTVRGEDDVDNLVVVQPDSGLMRLQGPVDDGSRGYGRLYGLGYDETADALYGFSADGEIVQINPFNGASQLLNVTEETLWWGATTNPVLW